MARAMDVEDVEEALRDLYAITSVQGTLIEHLLTQRFGELPRKKAKIYADALAGAMDVMPPPPDVNEREVAHYADAALRASEKLKAAVQRCLDTAHPRSVPTH